MNAASSEQRKRTAVATSSGDPETAERRVAEDEAGLLLGEHVGELGRDVAGRDRVHADAAGAELARQRLRQADDPGLGGGVVRLARVPVDADDAREVHDRAGAAAKHLPRDGAAGVEGAAQVRVDDLLPVLVAHARDQRVARDAGVVDEDVDVAELRLDALDQRLRLRGIADVRTHRDAADLRRDRLGRLVPGAVVHGHARAAARQLARDGGADAARAARDEGDLAVQ